MKKILVGFYYKSVDFTRKAIIDVVVEPYLFHTLANRRADSKEL